MEYKHSKQSDEQCIEIIRVLQTGGYSTEEEDYEKLDFLLRYYPGISNLIFWDKRELTPEQILEEAKKLNKPIQL